jgi:O-6-methylguanine DNA methyltransferase
LIAIPLGKALTFDDLARSIGAPGAAGAVSPACIRNPLEFLIPCHRVHADGSVRCVNRQAPLLACEGAL